MAKKREWNFACLNNSDVDTVAQFNIDVTETVVDEDGAPLESVDADGEPSLDMTMPETTEAAGEVEDTNELVEQLDDVQETMENYRSYIVEAIENRGGLTQHEFEAIMIGMKPHVPEINKYMPSAESFSYDRLTAATEALESLKQGLMGIWERIKDAVKTLYRKAKNWYLKTLDSAVRLKKRAEAVAKQADKVTGSIAEKRINLSIHRTIFDDKGKAYKSGSDAIKPLERLARLIFNALKDSTKASLDVIDAAEDRLTTMVNAHKSKNNLSDAEVRTMFIDTFKNLRQSKYDDSAFTKAYTPADGLFNPKKTDFLPGNKALVLKIGTDWTNGNQNFTSGDVSKYFRNIGIFLEEFNKDLKDTEGSAEYATLDTSNVRDITGHVETIADGITNYRKQWEERDKHSDRVIKVIDRIIKDVESDEDFEKNKNTRTLVVAILNGVKTINTNSVNQSTSIVTYAMNVSKAYLLYCTRSLAQYKK